MMYLKSSSMRSLKLRKRSRKTSQTGKSPGLLSCAALGGVWGTSGSMPATSAVLHSAPCKAAFLEKAARSNARPPRLFETLRE